MLPFGVPHKTHLTVFGQFSYVQALHDHFMAARLMATARLMSLFRALAASGEFGEVFGEFLKDAGMGCAVPDTGAVSVMLMFILNGWEAEDVITGTTFNLGVKHCVHRTAFGQFRYVHA